MHMNQPSKFPLRLISAALLPLFVAVGCANDHNRSASLSAPTDLQISQSTELDRYQASSDYYTQQESENDAKDYTPPSEITAADAGTEETVTGQTEDDTLPELELAAMAQEVLPAADVTETSDSSISQAEVAPAQEEMTVAKTEMPKKLTFHFGFDQHELSPEDVALIKQHASYMKQHPNATLVIFGHTDSYGNKEYNQYLSEERAQYVAKLLKSEGVKASRLLVAGLGDNVPLDNPDSPRDNRRVELNYQEGYFASN